VRAVVRHPPRDSVALLRVQPLHAACAHTSFSLHTLALLSLFPVNSQGDISVLPWTELEGLHRETSLIQVRFVRVCACVCV
jgi:hypothetical protein